MQKKKKRFLRLQTHPFVQAEFPPWLAEISSLSPARWCSLNDPEAKVAGRIRLCEWWGILFYFPTFSGHILGFSWLMWLEKEEMKSLAVNLQPPPHLGSYTPEWGSHISLSFLLKTSDRHLGGPQKPAICCHWKAVRNFTADSSASNYWIIKRQAPA